MQLRAPVAATDAIQFDISIAFQVYWIAERDSGEMSQLALFKHIFTRRVKSKSQQLRLGVHRKVLTMEAAFTHAVTAHLNLK